MESMDAKAETENKLNVLNAAGAALQPPEGLRPGLEIMSTTNGVRNKEISKKCYKSAVAAYVSLEIMHNYSPYAWFL